MKQQFKKMLWYLNRGKQEQDVDEAADNKLNVAQRKAADYLNRKTAGWSPAKTKIALILFCLAYTCLVALNAGRAILSANGPPKAIKVQRLFMPAPLLLPGNKSLKRPDSTPNKINH